MSNPPVNELVLYITTLLTFTVLEIFWLLMHEGELLNYLMRHSLQNSDDYMNVLRSYLISHSLLIIALD